MVFPTCDPTAQVAPLVAHFMLPSLATPRLTSAGVSDHNNGVYFNLRLEQATSTRYNLNILNSKPFRPQTLYLR